MFKNLQMQNKELQAETKSDIEQMPIVASPAQMPQNPMLCAVPYTRLIIKGGKNNKSFSRGLHKVFSNLIWVEIHHKFGDLWFFDNVELMSISEVELA